MIFKNSSKITDEDILLLRALVQTESTEILFEKLAEYDEDLRLSLNSLDNKLNPSVSDEELIIKIKKLSKIIRRKFDWIKKENWEEAAKSRDDEKNFYKEYFGFELKFNDIKKEGDYINDLKEYFIKREALLSEQASLSLLIQPGTANKDDIADLLFELSKLYRMLGGTGINFKLDGIRNPKNKFSYE